MYNPAIAKFLSVDPLAPSYPWYTPYQFAGNKPIEFVDMDGLEERKLMISKTEPKTATLTWRKVYYIINKGKGAINNYSEIDASEIQNILNSGENSIFVSRLPNEGSNKIKLRKERHWRKGKAYKLNISYDIEIRNSVEKNVFDPRRLTEDDTPSTVVESVSVSGAISNVMSNTALFGLIMSESFNGGITVDGDRVAGVPSQRRHPKKVTI